MGLRGVKNAVKRDLECVVHSFGQHGNPIVVSVAWVGFRTRGDTRRFTDLDDVYGTGNISPLGGAVLGLADVRFTGQHYQSRRAGAMAVIAEAEPMSGNVEEAMLDAIAEVAVLLPRP